MVGALAVLGGAVVATVAGLAMGAVHPGGAAAWALVAIVVAAICAFAGWAIASQDVLSDGDLATDTSVRRAGINPETGERYLEEMVFEVVNTQRLSDVTAKAEELAGRGVRRTGRRDFHALLKRLAGGLLGHRAQHLQVRAAVIEACGRQGKRGAAGQLDAGVQRDDDGAVAGGLGARQQIQRVRAFGLQVQLEPARRPTGGGNLDRKSVV